jgi:transcription elongation factor Elf1
MFAAIAAALAAFVLSWVEIARLGMWPEYATPPLAILALVSLFGPAYFRCPRCGERFGTRAGRSGSDDPFTRTCKHCGLPMGTPEAEAASFPRAPDLYLMAWQQLTRRTQVRLWGTALWAGVIAVGVSQRLDSRSFMIVFLAASLILIPYVILQESFVCPRCHERFFGGGKARSAKRCGHCGIEIGTPYGAPAADPKG